MQRGRRKSLFISVTFCQQMGWLTVWILTAVCRVLAKTNLIVVDYLIPKILSAKANSLHLSKLPKRFMTGSVFSLGQTALMSYLGKVLLIKGEYELSFTHEYERNWRVWDSRLEKIHSNCKIHGMDFQQRPFLIIYFLLILPHFLQNSNCWS